MFQILTLSPFALDPAYLMMASAQAGAVGILDLEFEGEFQAEEALPRLQRILERMPEGAWPGLRLHASQVNRAEPLLEMLTAHRHHLILCGWVAIGLTKTLAGLPASGRRQLMLEVTDVDELALLEESEAPIHGLIGKGSESGGWVGTSSSFILVQQLVSRTKLPVFTQGGIGPHTAAACSAAGAAGVVLDDQLWLMSESPLPEAGRSLFARLNGTEALEIGARLDAPLRILAGGQAAESLRKLCDETESAARWTEEASRLLGWGAPDDTAWPVGPAVALAAPLAVRYRTVGRLIQAILHAVAANPRLARDLRPLAPDSPLARAHATRFPIVQKLMTPLDDAACAVGQAGALPVPALGHLRAQEIRGLLHGYLQHLGQQPWGVLISGDLSPELREEQFTAIEAARPPFAILYGAEPADAARLEKAAIQIYLSVATPALLDLFLARGARRFVFQAEVEGQVAPLTPFHVWEAMIERLLDVPMAIAAEVQILLGGGGIRDARSGAMLSVMTAPLAARGMKIGVLMEPAPEASQKMRAVGSEKEPASRDLEERYAAVCQGSTEVLSQFDTSSEVTVPAAAPSDVAIVGLSVLVPGAQQPETFWTNILQKKASLREIPIERWDWRLYYDPDRTARDKVYSKWGGFIDEVEFDPFHFGIPPNSLKSIETMQLLALEATRRALTDAGYERGDFDRERTAVIFGTSGGMSDLGQQYSARSEIPRMFGKVGNDVYDRLPEWTEESFPGLLFNVAAGRVANRFDLGGSNFTVDAACASSLAALDLAVRELETGRCNVAIAGGLDTLQSPFAYFCFSKTQALSPSGTVKTFDEAADGIVISEGVAVVVLKRLADAERDGDRIYAVLKAVGSSSDGRSKSLTAPAPAGQLRALRQAYAKAGVSPATLGLYEAHGTGTTLGDSAELESFSCLLEESAAPQKACAVGSAKSLIGHTKSSAGIIGVVKAALALHRKVLPGHGGVERALEQLRDVQSPVYLPKQATPWLAAPSHPRRAAVSAFGFGGTNFHAVLEEHQNGLHEPVRGGDEWPCELFAWRAADRAALHADLTDFRVAVGRHAEASLRDLAFTLARRRPQGVVGLSFTARSREELVANLETALAVVHDPNPRPPGSGIELGICDAGARGSAQTALLFPGQGSQFPGMGREPALYLRELTQSLESASAQTAGSFPRGLDEYIFPRSDFSTDDPRLAEQELAQTNIAQPAIGALCCGYLDFLRRLGLQAGVVAGHSFGEYTALHAAGAISREELLRLASLRGQLMAGACEGNPGGMAAVRASREDVTKFLAQGPVQVANHNTPAQVVISGPAAELAEVVKALRDAGIVVQELAVAGAFHTPLMRSANQRLSEAIEAAGMTPPVLSIFSNVDGVGYGQDVASIRERLSRHLLESVEFVKEIEAIYAAGARVFVEVGPRSVLTSLVREILKDRGDIVTVAMDPERGTMQGLLRSVGKLFSHGVDLDLTQLFENRGCREIALSGKALPPTAPAKSAAQDWLISGGSVRKRSDGPGTTGKTAPLTSQSAEISLPAAKADSIVKKSSEKNAVNEPQPPDDSPEAAAPEYAADPNPMLLAYSAYQETMREFLRVQEEVMKSFLSGGAVPAGPVSPARPRQSAPVAAPRPAPSRPPARAAIPAPKPAPQPPSAPAPAVPTPEPRSNGTGAHLSAPAPEAGEPSKNGTGREALTQNLLRLVSERTGYPTEVLGLEQDLEADLGIDSIKRVEIFGAFRQHLPPDIATYVQQNNHGIMRLRTLKGWIDKLLENGANHNGGHAS